MEPDLEYLPAKFRDLSLKRQVQLYNAMMKERQDAAINCVLIGLKGLNQVHKMGLKSCADLSMVWGPAITDFYEAGNELANGWDQCGDSGDLITDPLSLFPDLSNRRKREIAAFMVRNRQEAHGNAYRIGIETIHKHCGFGVIRLDRLESQWLRDIRDFYNDRETAEPMLHAWLEEVGFVLEGGRIVCYRDADGKAVRKHTAEKIFREEEERERRRKERESQNAGRDPAQKE